ncbi:hypothetical protein [Alcanivorax jadensis]|uniref:hypothetical protein n=1 Tax=Alcanivorax jadensis TaxID=64988 RepID=UPI0035664BE9
MTWLSPGFENRFVGWVECRETQQRWTLARYLVVMLGFVVLNPTYAVLGYRTASDVTAKITEEKTFFFSVCSVPSVVKMPLILVFYRAASDAPTAEIANNRAPLSP